MQNPQYITNKENLAKFQEQALQIVRTQLNTKHDTGIEDLDDTLSSIITDKLDIEKRIDEIHDVIKLACNKTFPKRGPKKTVTTHKTVPWWTQELTVLRKRANAQRRLYQRTRNNDYRKETRKTQYLEGKTTYAATIKREKN
jgi:hypothetical protein